MKLVKVLETFQVAATGVTYTKGQELEVSDQLAKRQDGKRFKILKPSETRKSKVSKSN